MNSETRALIDEAYGACAAFGDMTPAGNLFRRLATALEASAVSSPPTITDDMVERAARAMYAQTNQLSMSGAKDLARAALAAALHSGGETNGD